MIGVNFSPKVIIFICMLVLCAWSTASAQHSVYLEIPNSVPSYCQETNIWCGVATTQMILEGYPGGVEHPFAQSVIWDTIVANRNDAGISWATDPDGLQKTLMILGGDPGVNWVIYHKPDSQALMYSVAYWMTARRYPTAVLVYGFQHWVMIDGFTTDVNPTSSSTIVLDSIEIVDPWNNPCPTAASGGVRSLMTGSNWFTNYWYSAGHYAASKWDGNYIAVIEPPKAEGTVKASQQVTKGKILPEKEILRIAVALLKERKFGFRPKYTALRDAEPRTPLLVNQKKKAYYVIPLSYKSGEYCQGAILLNAYNGEFQEIGVFQKPIIYMTQEKAIRIAACHLNAGRVMKQNVSARLIFEPSAQNSSRFLPLWMITIGKVSVYIAQDGTIIDRLIPLPLGD